MAAPPLKLAYVVIESKRTDAWRTFARDGLGFHVDQTDAGDLAFRLDDYQRRFIVTHGAAEDVVALGWETPDPAAARAHLESHGVTTSDGSGTDASRRAVDAFFAYSGPKGLHMEFCAPPRRTNIPLQMRAANGFATGAGGLGHAVVTTRFPEKVRGDFERLLGARLSDTITDKIDGVEMEITFLHLNERHHSIALAATKGVRVDPLKRRIQHLMIEARSLDDVTDAYLRCKALGYRIAMSMGRHPNDKGISFYVVSPSGVEFEMGCEPIRIEDETAWSPQTYRGTSTWGHKPEFKPSPAERLGTLWNALTSLSQKEPS